MYPSPESGGERRKKRKLSERKKGAHGKEEPGVEQGGSTEEPLVDEQGKRAEGPVAEESRTKKDKEDKDESGSTASEESIGTQLANKMRELKLR